MKIARKIAQESKVWQYKAISLYKGVHSCKIKIGNRADFKAICYRVESKVFCYMNYVGVCICYAIEIAEED